ncbi:MAG: murein biosynthesis integral membrane protein MurJ, partial [Actinomycetota bacterium]
RRWTRFKDTMNTGIRATTLIIVPCCVIYLILNQPIIRFLFQHGFFKSGDTDILSGVLFFFALGLIPYSIDMLLTKTFYSLQDTRTPMIINCFVVAINICANLIYFYWLDMGVRGLALGYATAYVFSMLIDGTVLRLRLGRLGGRRAMSTAVKTLIAAAAMAGVIYASYYMVHNLYAAPGLIRELLEMLLPMLEGVVVFFGVAHLLKMEELDMLRELYRRYLGRLRSGRAKAGDSISEEDRTPLNDEETDRSGNGSRG